MAEQAKDFSRGKISKPLAQEIIKYINDPIARSDFEHSYDTMLDINRAHVLMLCKQHIISGKKSVKRFSKPPMKSSRIVSSRTSAKTLKTFIPTWKVA